MASRKGRPNILGRGIKENIVAVFTRIGGTPAMAKWAAHNRTEFYKIYARLLPTDATLNINIRDVTELTDGELLLIATGRSAGAADEADVEGIPHEIH